MVGDVQWRGAWSHFLEISQLRTGTVLRFSNRFVRSPVNNVSVNVLPLQLAALDGMDLWYLVLKVGHTNC